MNLNAASQDKSRCREFMCPKMIAVAVDESRSTQMVFARGSDSAMYYRRIVGDGWDSGEWESLGGDFSSQPAAAEVRDGAIMVFGVWSLPQEVRVKTFREGRWSGTWDTLNSTSCSAQPYAFNWGVDHVTVLCTQATGHVWWTRFKGSWASEWSDRGSASLGTPAASSGEPGAMVMVTYSKASDTGNYEMIFSRYASEWLDWEGNWGNFKGDPEILGRNATRYDFLGVARSDGSMWHLARISDRDNSTDADDGSRPAKLPSQYTTPYRLGGEWESTPVAVGFSDSRFDVLAVYKNDTLMHRASINDDWGSGWEDLGGYFNSAPAVWVNGSSVVVFGLGPNGKMVHGVFEVDLDTASWGEGKWYNNGGNFSSGGFALTNDPGPEGKKNDS